MHDFRPGDHAMGLELQLEELTERERRAAVQGDAAEAARLGVEIAAVQAELAATAERLALEGQPPDPEPELVDADRLAGPAEGAQPG